METKTREDILQELQDEVVAERFIPNFVVEYLGFDENGIVSEAEQEIKESARNITVYIFHNVKMLNEIGIYLVGVKSKNEPKLKSRTELTDILHEIIYSGDYEKCSADLLYDIIDRLNYYKEETDPEDTYVSLTDIQKFPIRANHQDKENGNEHFIYGIETVMEYINSLPKYKRS